ncbi:MAG: MoxR family ATPase [Candidatus Eremiobacteraeota bacterium]|nr:MoxR family ATPase [Candidatus Eremiobacteraeota bacterium]
MEKSAQAIQDTFGKISAEITKVLVGQKAVIEQILACLLAGGHMLLEGVPGTAKTLLSRTLAHTIGGEFRRIQFTPDLMPSDVMGTEVFTMATSSFELKKGPIFTDILLADEINRTPPKTQSALLECMQERTTSIAGKTYTLSPVFTVLATQNPIEYEGTYPLPEAQLDRFMLKLLIQYPSPDEELQIYRRYEKGEDLMNLKALGVAHVVSLDEVMHCRESISTIRVEEDILKYISSIIQKTREMPKLSLGGSPRAGISLLQVSRSLAAIRGKDYLSPDEVKEMAPPVLRHRLIVTPEAQVEGVTQDKVVNEILAMVKVPR